MIDNLKSRNAPAVAASRRNSRRKSRGETLTSAAAANVELAIDRCVLFADMLEIAGSLGWNVGVVRLAVADRRAADQRRARCH
jgi:hypothetical protein